MVDLEAPRTDLRLPEGSLGQPYRSLLAVGRLDGDPLGVAAVSVEPEGGVSGDRLAEALRRQLEPELREAFARRGLRLPRSLPAAGIPGLPAGGREAPARGLSVSVVVPTCCDPLSLERCLSSILACDYGDFEVIVVENRPASTATRRMLSERFPDDTRVRYAEEARPGASHARNTGLALADGEVVAFADDDVIVDPAWLRRSTEAFGRGDDIACVTALILPLELEHRSQLLLEQLTAFGRGFRPHTYRLPEVRDGHPLFPYTRGMIGAGANTAVRKDVARQLGGFDTTLGAATPAVGGEDLDLYIRLLNAGHAVAYEPSAIVWHEHPAAKASLRRRVYRYGVGVGATLAKQVFAGPERMRLLRGVRSGVRYAGEPTCRKNGRKMALYPRRLEWLERLGMVIGPVAYLMSALVTTSRRLPRVRGGASVADQTAYVERFVLSSGKTIELVSFKDREIAPPSAGNRADAVAAGTARVRLVMSAASLGSLAAAAIAVAVGAAQLRLACMLFFCLVGIGSAPWQHNVGLRLPARLTLTLLTGLAVLTLVPLLMLAAGGWHPLATFLVVALVSTPLHVTGLRSALADTQLPYVRGRPITRVSAVTTALAGAGAASCLAAAVAHRHLDPGFYGFVVQIGPLWYLGLALLLVALVSPRGDEEQEMALPLVLLVLVLTLTPALVYDGARSQSAAKYVDLVTQIRTHHGLVSTFDIYNNWSGFFASIAWLSDITGIRDPMRFATFWPPLLALFRVAALRFLFGQLLSSARQCWLAVALAVLADSLGADYFSPQSVGFVLGLAVFGVALSRYHDSVRLMLVLVAGCVLATSHQLSPYMVGGVLVVLVIFKQVRPWWTPLLVLGPAVLWALGHAHALQGFLSLEAIGKTHNFEPPKTAASPGLERLPVVRETVLAMLFAIAIVGSLAFIGLLRKRSAPRSWALACCPGVGLVLCAINPYGQEGIFRAVLFGLPWLAVLAASSLSAPPRLLTRLGALGVAAALTAAFLIASFGLDATNVVRPADVAAYQYFEEQGGPHPAIMHDVLSLGTGDMPTFLPTRRGGHQPLTRGDIGVPVRQHAHLRPEREMRRLTGKLLRYSGESVRQAQLYAIWSPVQADYGAAYAVQSSSQAAELRDAFLRSPYWHVAFRQHGTLLFRFAPDRYVAGAR
jgi:GT2 family glycosyltransferase